MIYVNSLELHKCIRHLYSLTSLFITNFEFNERKRKKKDEGKGKEIIIKSVVQSYLTF